MDQNSNTSLRHRAVMSSRYTLGTCTVAVQHLTHVCGHLQFHQHRKVVHPATFSNSLRPFKSLRVGSGGVPPPTDLPGIQEPSQPETRRPNWGDSLH